MIEKPIDEITPRDLHELAARQVCERRTLDYKRNLDFRRDADKKELVADVLSFANTAGGDIVFGMDEARDSAGGKLGYPEPPVGTKLWGADDDVRRAIEQCVRDSSEPRIPALDIGIVHGFSEGAVVVIRVGRSTAAPHRSLRDNGFYTRATTGRYQLDVAQLRSLFVDAAAQEQATRSFVRRRVEMHFERIHQVSAREVVPIRLEEGEHATARLIVHLVASSFGDRGQVIDLRTFPSESKIAALLPSSRHARWMKRHNLDGVVLWHCVDGYSQYLPQDGYRQIFRHGAIECVDCSLPSAREEQGALPGDEIEERVLENCRSGRDLLNDAGCAFPVFVFIALTGVFGRRLTNRGATPRELREHVIERQVLALPDVALLAPDVDIQAALRPPFDALWQAGGWSGSPTYGPDGGTKRG